MMAFAPEEHTLLTVVQGTVLVVASAYVVVNFLVDIAYRLTDPRIRRG